VLTSGGLGRSQQHPSQQLYTFAETAEATISAPADKSADFVRQLLSHPGDGTIANALIPLDYKRLLDSM
jgi:hypothetical protein